MAYPNNLNEKVEAAIVWFANAVASEAANTPNHDKRLALAKRLLDGGGAPDRFVRVDFATQGYTDATPLDDVQNRLSGLATNLINLGFGG